MVSLRRQYKSVTAERRNNTRIELHLPVVILGVDERAQIIDFSLNGFHIETRSQTRLETGRHITLALQLPSERGILKIRAKVVYQDSKGIGCEFINLTPHLAATLQRCFSIFNATMPVD